MTAADATDPLGDLPEPATAVADASQPAGLDPDPLSRFDDVIELVVPARVEHLRLARLAAAGVASSQGFDVDALEELRIGVDELAAGFVDSANGATRLRLRFFPIEGGVEVRGHLEGAINHVAPTLHRVAQELLSMVVDEYGMTTEETGPAFYIRKTVRSGAAS